MKRSDPKSPLKPRRQPLQERAERTVAVIIEAAAQVLETEGLEGFNTNAVAQRAGVSVGSLYQYFPNKDALTLALMRREESQFHAEAVAALAYPSGRECMERYIDAAVRQQLARPRLAKLLDIEESRFEPDQESSGSPSFRELLEAVLERDDLPRPARVQVAARDLLSIIRGLTDAAGQRGESDLADLHRRITAAVFGYLQGVSGDPP
jgi:AcrR family transcriptional regulator